MDAENRLEGSSGVDHMARRVGSRMLLLQNPSTSLADRKVKIIRGMANTTVVPTGIFPRHRCSQRDPGGAGMPNGLAGVPPAMTTPFSENTQPAGARRG